MAILYKSTLFTLGLLGGGVVGIAMALVFFLVEVLYNSVILWVVSKLFKLHNKKFTTAFITALVASMINFVIGYLNFLVRGGNILETTESLLKLAPVWVAMFVVYSLTAKKFYKLETGKSFLIGLVWTAAAIIMGAIFEFITAAWTIILFYRWIPFYRWF